MARTETQSAPLTRPDGTPIRILAVDDETSLTELLSMAMRYEGWQVTTASSGSGAVKAARETRPDAIVLDMMLPDFDGLEVMRRIRAESPDVPVIFLTAKDAVEDRVKGLNLGADDYLVKPFAFDELMARVRALLRRSAGHAKSEFNCGPVRLDTRTGRVAVDGNPVKLTSHEYRLLSYLMHHAGRVVSRTELVEHLYDQDFDRDSNTIEVFVGRVRKKIGAARIETVRGLGYRLVCPEDEVSGTA